MKKDYEKLKQKAKLTRINILKMLEQSGTGHPGGSLSCVELLVALYYYKMNIDAKNPKWEQRDRFILSKGHAAPALYAILADKGYFPEEELWDLRKFGSILQGHPDMKKTPGVDMCTGSLGQGFSTSVGFALAGKMRKNSFNVYSVLGDGELQEGIIWEACMAASHYKLDNLTAIVDNNNLQIDGCVDDVMSLGDLKAKFESFGFYVIKVDGHNFEEILSALDDNRNDFKPKCIIASTVKGKGVSYMENKFEWHGGVPSGEQMKQAQDEVGEVL